jgi:hypothetical protein
VQQADRNWIDADGDFVPDCDLINLEPTASASASTI